MKLYSDYNELVTALWESGLVQKIVYRYRLEDSYFEDYIGELYLTICTIKDKERLLKMANKDYHQFESYICKLVYNSLSPRGDVQRKINAYKREVLITDLIAKDDEGRI